MIERLANMTLITNTGWFKNLILKSHELSNFMYFAKNWNHFSNNILEIIRKNKYLSFKTIIITYKNEHRENF